MSFTLYDFAKDQGSLIAGLLALLAGLLAYFAAMRQVKTTREAAQQQIEQMVSDRTAYEAARTELDQRIRDDLLRSIGIEASRIKMETNYRITIASVVYDKSPRSIVSPANLGTFRITASEFLRNGSAMTALLSRDVVKHVNELLAKVDQLSTQLAVHGSLADFHGDELLAGLNRVAEAAGMLEGSVATAVDKSRHSPKR